MRMPWSGDKENKESKKRQSIIDLLFTHFSMHWWLLGFVSALAVFFIAFPMEEQRRPLDPDDFELGKGSPRDVFAQLNVVYYDKGATATEKRRASTEVPPVFNLEFQRVDNAREEFNIVRQAQEVKASLDLRFLPVLDNGNIIEELRQKLKLGDKEVLLSQNASVFIQEAGSNWLITDKDVEIYVVRKERDKLNVYLADTEKISRMRRSFYIDPSDAMGLILAQASDEELGAMEKAVIQVLSDVLARGVIAGRDERGNRVSFAEKLSQIEHLKPKWGRIREELEQQLGRRPTNDEIAATMSVIVADTRKAPFVKKTVSVEELLLWREATDTARDMAKEMKWPISAVVEEMCVWLVRPNLEYDPVATRKHQMELMTDFPPISRTIPRGNKIVGVGDTVTESIKGKLEAMSRAQKLALWRAVPGAILLVALLAFALAVYLKRYEPSIFSEPRKIIALNIVILLVLVLGELIIISGPALRIEHPGFLIPAALAPMVIAMLASVQLAIVITCIIGVFIAMLAGVDLVGSLDYFLVVLTGGVAAAISASRARHRRHLIMAGIYVAWANVITILGLGLLKNASFVELGENCLIGGINGVTVAVLTPGLLPIFEYLSRTTTDMELLELADLNQPLLAQLKGKTGGTYYHSLDIAKLAEAAAEEVGANPLLVRVGSYYHDIGKTVKPENFIENQKGENVHDNLNPRMSARIIAQHVKDGVGLAEKYKLPQVVTDIIQQHHGTTLIGGKRFYQKAMEADKHNAVRLEDYRYPGAKPQTKEAAIVQLADSVESARHAVLNGSPTYSRLVSFVREIVEDKIMDFQLDECDLTLRDIRSITDAFVRVLSGIYHTRIEYPKAVEQQVLKE